MVAERVFGYLVISLLGIIVFFSGSRCQEIKTVRMPFVVNSNLTGTQKNAELGTIDAKGQFVVVWEDTPSHRVFFQRLDPFGEPVEALSEANRWVSNSNIFATQPTVDDLAMGDFIVSFIGTQMGSSDEYIWGQIFETDADTIQQGENFRIETEEYSSGIRRRVSLALYTGDPLQGSQILGFGLAGWHGSHFSTDDDDVLLSGFTLPDPLAPPVAHDSLGWIEELDRSGGSQRGLAGEQDLAVDSDGTFVVVYTIGGVGSTPYRVNYRTFQAGTWAASDTILIDSIGSQNDLLGPSVAVDGEDNRIFAYSKREPGGDFHVFFVRYDVDENRLDALPDTVDFATPAGPDYLYVHPSVAAFKNGDFVVSWLSADQAIYARRFDSSGSPIDVNSDLLLVGPGNIEDPEMDVFKDKIYLTWTDVSDGGDVKTGVWSVDTESPTADSTEDEISDPEPYIRLTEWTGHDLVTTFAEEDLSSRIPSGLHQVRLIPTFTYSRYSDRCSYADTLLMSTACSQCHTQLVTGTCTETGLNSGHYTGVIPDSTFDEAGTFVKYYIEAVDSALNVGHDPRFWPDEYFEFSASNPGDINFNGLLDDNDLSLLSLFLSGGDLTDRQAFYADVNIDGTIDNLDCDTLAKLVEPLPPYPVKIDCPPLGLPLPGGDQLEMGVGSGGPGDQMTIPLHLDNDSSLVRDVFYTLDFDTSIVQLVQKTTTSRTSGFTFVEPCSPGADIAGQIFITGGASAIQTGSGAILNLVFQLDPNAPEGKYHITLTRGALNGPESEDISHPAYRGKFFVPTSPPISIVTTPIGDTLLVPSDTLTFNTTLTNHSDSTISPKFFVYGTTTGPDSFTFLAVDTTEIAVLPPGGRKREITELEVPLSAPFGHYIFTAHVVSPVTGSTFDDDAFGFEVSSQGRPGYGGDELASSGKDMEPWKVLRGWFGYNERTGRKATDESASLPLPRSFSVSQNYPNPFNPSTTIRYDIPEGDGSVPVNISVYDLRGRMVAKLVDEQKVAGRYEVHWDGRNDTGQKVASGVYLYRIIAGEFVSTRKMMIVQ